MAVLIAALASAAITGCRAGDNASGGATESARNEAVTEEASEEASEESQAQETDYTTGVPWLYSNIDSNVPKDMEPVSLKDDFYLAVNGEKLAGMSYRPGEMEESVLSLAAVDVEENMMELLTDESVGGHEAELIRTYYKLLDDWEARGPLARARIEQGLAQIEGFRAMKDYCDAVRDWRGDSVLNEFVEFGLAFASDDSSVWIAGCGGPALSLGDSAEYTELTDSGKRTKELNLRLYEYANQLLGLGTAQEAEEEYERMLAFEARIAEHTMTVADTMRAEAIEERDNYMTVGELDTLLGENPGVAELLACNRFVPERIYVPEPEQLRFVGELLNDEGNLEELKNYLKVNLLISQVGSLSKEALLHVQELEKEIYGLEEIQEYDKVLLAKVRSTLSVPMQMTYTKKYATPEMKEEIAGLCREIAAEYREMLLAEDWISEETKAEAVRKLDSLTIYSLYPDKWEDYSGLDISGMNLYEAEAAINRFDCDLGSSYLNQKVDKDIWLDDITDTNAYYWSNNNSITILLGLVGEGTYTVDMGKEELYGRIGAVIAHEISHAFDSTGGQFDADGTLVSWWAEEDLAEFNARIEKVRSYYNKVSIYGDKLLDGAMLDGEATADIAGVQCLLRLAKKDEDFDYDKMFRAYADLWCGKYIPYVADYFYVYDSHPPAYLRVNATLQQFDEFLKTYGITEGDGMYLAPEERITVW